MPQAVGTHSAPAAMAAAAAAALASLLLDLLVEGVPLEVLQEGEGWTKIGEVRANLTLR